MIEKMKMRVGNHLKDRGLDRCVNKSRIGEYQHGELCALPSDYDDKTNVFMS